MKAVLISINPKWCELIASGKKTVEVRKTKPKLKTPFKCYIYCTKPRIFWAFADGLYTSSEYLHLCEGKVIMGDGFDLYDKDYEVLNGYVIGEFICDRIRTEYEVADGLVDVALENTSCVSYKELIEYSNGKMLYAWHISDLVIYEKPRELDEFSGGYIKRPPQSYCYVED